MFTTTLRRLPIWQVQAITLGTFVVWYLETWIWHFAQLHPVLVGGIWQHLCSWASIVLPCSSGCKPKSLQQPRYCQSARYGWKGLDHRWFWLCKACPILQEMCQITSSALDKKQLRFAVGDVSVSLAFCSVVVFMGTRIMSPDILMAIHININIFFHVQMLFRSFSAGAVQNHGHQPLDLTLFQYFWPWSSGTFGWDWSGSNNPIYLLLSVAVWWARWLLWLS